MALERKTVVDQIEIRRDGTIQVRIAKLIVDGDEVIASEFHRCAIEPGRAVEELVSIVDDGLQQLGAAAPGKAEWDRVRAIVRVVHTPQTVEAFARSRDSALRGAQAN